MATISSLGVGSNLDLSSLLDSLTEAEQTRLDPITQRQDSYNAKLTAYGTLKSALTSFQSAVSKLNDASLYQSVKATAGGSAFTATADETAVDGKYNVAVTRLAQAQSLATTGQADGATFAQGNISIKLFGTDDAVDVTIDSSNNTLEGIRDAINAADAGVTATIVSNGDSTAPYQLVLTADETGTDAAVQSITVTESASSSSDLSLHDLLAYSNTTVVTSSDFDGTTGTDATSSSDQGMTQYVSAKNAQLTVNGIGITSQTNTVEGAIQGVTLNLASTTDGGTESLALAKDTDTVKSAIEDFVSAYNTLETKMASLREVDTSDSSNSGVLVGDSTLRRIESSVRSSLTSSTSNNDSFAYLAQIGVALDKDGQLTVDDTKLDTALSNNLDDIGSLFAGTDASDTDGVIGGLSSTLTQVLDSNGILQNATDGIETSLEDLDDQATRMQATIDATIARYKTQFTQLDVLMSTMNSTTDYLTQQFDAMNNSNSN